MQLGAPWGSGRPPPTEPAPSNCSLGGYTAMTPYVVTLDAIVCVAAVSGNLLVMVAVARFRSLRTTTNTFVVALAGADLLAALSVPYYISFYFDVSYRCEEGPCLARYFVTNATNTMSILLLVVVSVDRFVAVKLPLRYPALMSRRRALSLVVIIYVYSLLLNSIVLVDELNAWTPAAAECDLVYVLPAATAVPLVAGHVLMALAATTGLYVGIFREAWRQNRMAREVTGPGPRCHRPSGDTKTACMMVLILGCNTVAMLPYALGVCLRYAYIENIYIHENVLSELKKMFVSLYFAKSAINPVVYGWKNAEFAAAFRQIVGCGDRSKLRRHSASAICTVSGRLRRHLDPVNELSSSASVETIDTYL
ncbi:adenosine receptor A2b-like isoform X2 [Amphibalanus amphitrite]|uniref:adenosine receptor A2b-like isoform X2 n=1 Tax=Amphibalanus amphitrite TaxID=1232801 RepID=UPI001C91E497|nr:adenosine receptor A2b-like isoform X2 [Amphibalanus amphitrite]XP_043230670.1 adenosine receptor A2b-like isoform X2 [Amphibalanus amphitrite]